MAVEPEHDGHEPWLTISRSQEVEILHRELAALPEKYREPILLCHLQGHSRAEAALLLDETEASVKASLARGRKLLRRRLMGRGIAFSVVMSGFAVRCAQASSVEPALIEATLQSCRMWQSGEVLVNASAESGFNLTSFELAKSITHQGVFSMFVHSVSKPVVLLGLAVMALVAIPIAFAANSSGKSSAESSIALEGTSSVLQESAVQVVSSQKKQDPEKQKARPKSRSEILQEIEKSRNVLELKKTRYRLQAIETKIESIGLKMNAAKADDLLRLELKSEMLELYARKTELETELLTLDAKKALGKAGAAHVPPSSKTPLEPGEALNIEVYDVESLSRRVVVMADSTVVLPFLGVVSVKGESPSSLQTKINKLYTDKRIIKDDMVQVTRASTSMPLSSSSKSEK